MGGQQQQDDGSEDIHIILERHPQAAYVPQQQVPLPMPLLQPQAAYQPAVQYPQKQRPAATPALANPRDMYEYEEERQPRSSGTVGPLNRQ